MGSSRIRPRVFMTAKPCTRQSGIKIPGNGDTIAPLAVGEGSGSLKGPAYF